MKTLRGVSRHQTLIDDVGRRVGTDMKATEREADVAHVRAALLGGYGTVLEEWGVWTGETTLQVGDDLSYKYVGNYSNIISCFYCTMFWSHARPRLLPCT
jgi:hypothetical protein